MFNYIETRHGINIINIIWKITNSINEQKIVKVKYKRQDGKLREYLIKPLGLLFNEYYFYLIGEIKGKSNEIVFRIDRFIEYSVTNERFSVMYKDRFKEGEFLNKIQEYDFNSKLVCDLNEHGINEKKFFDSTITNIVIDELEKFYSILSREEDSDKVEN